MNETELSDLLDWMNPQIEGSQLQDVWSDGDGLVLDCYRSGQLQIYIDLRPNQCFLTLWKGRDVRKRRPKPRPLSLFVQSHAKNATLVRAALVPDQGRVAELEFKRGETTVLLRLILIPQGPNVTASSSEGGSKQEKVIHWAKPKSLEARKSQGAEVKEFPIHWLSWDEYHKAYLVWRWTFSREQNVTPSLDPRIKSWSNEVEKKIGLVQKLEKALASEEDLEWQAFGEKLKLQSGPLPGEEKFWDSKRSLSENRERAFQKAKDLRAKREGIRERIAILTEESEKLKGWIHSPESAESAQSKKGRGTQILSKTESRGRTLNLPSGLQAVLGKSAKDNLAILRQARSWDYWIHLKDEPSAHAILFREKNQKVSNEDLELVSQWILRSGSAHKSSLDGTKYDVVVVECRFVRPIKGDKLGRVNYQSPQVYTFASKRKP